MTKTRRKVGGYIWNEKLAEVHRKHGNIRDTTNEIIQALEGRPPSARVLLAWVAQIALYLNAADAALREIELIAREHGG